MKNNSGFSLVEVIVVIAIMAILAGVAVPTYSKYIAKANDATVNAQLDEVKTAAFAGAAAKGTTVDKITITITSEAADETAVAVVAKDTTKNADATAEAKTLLGDTFSIDFDNTSYEKNTSLEWANGTWTGKGSVE